MVTERAAWGGLAFVLAFVAAFAVERLARRFGVVDRPGPRKIHHQPVPLLGGVAIYLAVAVCVGGALWSSGTLTSGSITLGHYLGFLTGGLILMVGGALDDRYNLPPHLSLIAPLLAALAAVFGGIEISKITNPFGGVILIEPWQSNVLVFAWLLVVMYTTKFLDGLDGLATGVSAVGMGMVLGLSLTVAYFQPDVALLSSIALGATLGFLVRNFHPAKIFLGEGGSTFVGYLLGTLAVISGGKLATALLVVGIPLLDVAWAVLRRASTGGLKNITKADRKHLHHRLLDLGWGQRRVAVTYYLVAAAFGAAAMFLQSGAKLVALSLLGLLMLVAVIILDAYDRRRQT